MKGDKRFLGGRFLMGGTAKLNFRNPCKISVAGSCLWCRSAVTLATVVLAAYLSITTFAPKRVLAAVSAKIVVVRTAEDQFRFSSTRTIGGAVCTFPGPILVFGAEASSFPLIGSAGTTQPDGSLLVDRSDLLDLLSRDDARFVAFNTDCGSNGASFGAKALLNLIEPLGTVTIPTLYGPGGGGGASVENLFLRGDSNADGTVDISDSVFTLNYLFVGGPPSSCQDAADTNDDGKVDLSDPVYSLSFLFLGGPAPGQPFDKCGADLSADELTCESAPGCP